MGPGLASAKTVTLAGDKRDISLWATGCRVEVTGGRGDDVLKATATEAASAICGARMLGQDGDDRLVGSDEDDVLIGGSGRDRADGGPGPHDRSSPSCDATASLTLAHRERRTTRLIVPR